MAGGRAVDLHGRESGRLYPSVSRPGDRSGVVLEVQHSRHGQTPLGSQLLRFSHVAFDDAGTACVAADQLGNLFILDIAGQIWRLIQRLDLACTALEWHADIIIAAVADNSIQLYNQEGQKLMSALEHRTCVKSISTSAGANRMLTTSTDESILWNLKDLSVQRTLHGAADVGIQLAVFSHSGEHMFTCFRNDEILAWDTDRLQIAYKLHPPRRKHAPLPHYRTMACAPDGRLLVAGGRSRLVSVYTLASATLARCIALPEPVLGVRMVQFVGLSARPSDNLLVAILCDTGRVELIDAVKGELVCTIGVGGASDYIDAMSLCPQGRYLATIMTQGCVRFHSLDAAIAAASASVSPRRPVKVVDISSNPKSDGTTVGSITAAQTIAPKQRPGKKKRAISSSTAAERNRTEVQNSFAQIREEKLSDLLMGYGEYPSKYRKYIWKQLLQLPENADVYQNLVNKGTHSAFAQFHQSYPMKSRKLLRISQKNLSALAHWAPIMGEVRYLPHLAFPFMKYLENTPFVSFELVMTIIINWCRQWFEFFPNPPINVLNMVENVLTHHEPALHKHLLRCGVTSQIYAWPLLQNMLSDVFEEAEWLAIWDNVLSNPPGFLLLIVVAYTAVNKGTLMHATEMKDFQYFFNRFNSVGVQKVIRKARRLARSTPRDINPIYLLGKFTPLPVGSYPIFNSYPAFIVDFQVQERERIRQEELDFLRERAAAIESRKQVERLKLEEEAWSRQQELLLEAEQDRRERVRAEEQRLAEQRRRLEQIKRDQVATELRAYEDSRRRFIEQQKVATFAELARMDDRVRAERKQEQEATTAAINDTLSTIAQAGILQGIDTDPAKIEGLVTERELVDKAAVDSAPTTDVLSRIEVLSAQLDRSKVDGRRAFERDEMEALRQVYNVRERIVQSRSNGANPLDAPIETSPGGHPT